MKRSWMMAILIAVLFLSLGALAACTGTGTGQTGTQGTLGGGGTATASEPDTMGGSSGSMGTATNPANPADAAKVDCSTVRCAACEQTWTVSSLNKDRWEYVNMGDVGGVVVCAGGRQFLAVPVSGDQNAVFVFAIPQPAATR